MSYDLYFWKYAGSVSAAEAKGKQRSHVEVMNALVRGAPPETVPPLPTDEIEAGLVDLLSADWNRDGIFWQKDGAVIETFFGSHHVSFSMRGRWKGDHANLLVDLMNGFGCALYDPQVGERFSA